MPPPPASATVEDVTSSEAVVLWEPPVVPGDYQGYLIQIKSASLEIVETFRRGRYDERRITMSFSGHGETLTACVFTTTGTAVEIVTSSPVLVDVTSGSFVFFVTLFFLLLLECCPTVLVITQNSC